MKARRQNLLRNLTGGFIGGFGGASFFCFIFLAVTWSAAAPGAPQPELGLTLPQNDHGRIVYWSAFQSTSAFLLLFTSFPLMALGAMIGPTRKVLVRSSSLAWMPRWDPDDPDRVLPWGLAMGAATAPAFIFLAGPAIVRALNASGISLTLG